MWSLRIVVAIDQEAAPDDFEYSFAGERRLKGFDARMKLYRVRRGEPR